MFKEIFDNVREKCPLIHNITNYVTVNDCANVVLACGASPIMADDKDEVSDIQTICGGLNINIGTLNSRTIESMLLAGKRANELGHPVVLDAVGAGASKLRTETANQLLKEVRFTVIRGNISEIKTLALGNGTTKGVDADLADRVTKISSSFMRLASGARATSMDRIRSGRGSLRKCSRLRRRRISWRRSRRQKKIWKAAASWTA